MTDQDSEKKKELELVLKRVDDIVSVLKEQPEEIKCFAIIIADDEGSGEIMWSDSGKYGIILCGHLEVMKFKIMRAIEDRVKLLGNLEDKSLTNTH
jgi:hypothetical protein